MRHRVLQFRTSREQDTILLVEDDVVISAWPTNGRDALAANFFFPGDLDAWESGVNVSAAPAPRPTDPDAYGRLIDQRPRPAWLRHRLDHRAFAQPCATPSRRTPEQLTALVRALFHRPTLDRRAFAANPSRHER